MIRSTLRRLHRRPREQAPPRLLVAPLAPGDPGPVLAVFEAMSPRSRALRFGAPTVRLSRAMLDRLTDLRPGEHEASAVWRAGRPLGIVRWHRDPARPDVAELALEVADDSRRLGLGRLLVEHAAVRLADIGVHDIEVQVSADNAPALTWLRALGARRVPGCADRCRIPVAQVRSAADRPRVA